MLSATFQIRPPDIVEEITNNLSLDDLSMLRSSFKDDTVERLFNKRKDNHTESLTDLMHAFTPNSQAARDVISRMLYEPMPPIHIDGFSNIRDLPSNYATIIADFLKDEREEVIGLYLNINNIGDDGATAVADALKHNTRLTALSLYKNNIGDNGATAVADALKHNTRLTALSLNHNPIHEKGLKMIGQALHANRTLKTLHLGNNNNDENENNEDVVPPVAPGNDNGNDGSYVIIALALRQNSSLTELYITHSNIHDQDAKALASTLKVNNTLTHLDLSGNKFGPEGSGALASALKKNTVLTELDLGQNNINVEGAKAIGGALKVNKGLISLNLSDTNIGGATEWIMTGVDLIGINKVGSYMRGRSGERMIVTSYRRRHFLEDDADHYINQVKLVNADEIQEGVIAIAEALQGNQWSNTQREMFGLPPNKEGSKLARLDLSNNDICNKSAATIAENLATNRVLTELYLHNNAIGNGGADAIAKLLGVSLSGHLRTQELTRLDLSSNIIGDEGAFAIAAALRTNEVLTNLDLESNRIGNEGAEAIGKALSSNKVLTNLDLGRNRIGDEGAEAICKGLKTNTVLTELNLGHNNINATGAGAIAKALFQRPALQIRPYDLRAFN